MKGFERNNQLLSLCGLNCGLCSMFIEKTVPAAVQATEIKAAGSPDAA